MAQKFILQGESLKISASVDFHRELVSKPREPKMPWGKQEIPPPVKGGGWWIVNKEDKFLLLYSSSEDFGPVSREDLIAAVPETYFSSYWNGYDVYYSPANDLGAAMLDKELIFKIDRDL